jgi:16S rRNA (guanine527-N7)-methyltransferase
MPPASDEPARLEAACRTLGLDLPAERLSRLLLYASLVRERNAHVNLVSRRDADRVVSYHLVDSLASARFLASGTKVCDIGTGAGLPGIPLAIARPDLQVALVDSTRKKCLFLEEAIQELELPNTVFENARAEDLPGLDCDTVISRVTGPLDRVLRQLHHHRSEDGRVLFYKATGWREQFEQAGPLLRRLGLGVTQAEVVRLPVTGIERHFVIIGRV